MSMKRTIYRTFSLMALPWLSRVCSSKNTPPDGSVCLTVPFDGAFLLDCVVIVAPQPKENRPLTFRIGISRKTNNDEIIDNR